MIVSCDHNLSVYDDQATAIRNWDRQTSINRPHCPRHTRHVVPQEEEEGGGDEESLPLTTKNKHTRSRWGSGKGHWGEGIPVHSS